MFKEYPETLVIKTQTLFCFIELQCGPLKSHGDEIKLSLFGLRYIDVRGRLGMINKCRKEMK